LEKMHECEDYLDRRRDTALEAMATLYLPELKSEADRFVFTCRDERLLIIKLGQAVLNAKNDPTAQEAAYEDFRSKWNRQELRNAHNALTAAEML
jgi:hypothetical protein